MEAITKNELNILLTVLKNNGYKIFERPYELNIVGVRTDNWTPNKFDDYIFVFYKDDKGNWVGTKNPATTDPGTYWLKNPMSPQGTAILKKGQYINSHAIGSHRGQYTALVQVAPVTTIRDFDRDNKLSYESLKSTTGLYGINIHRAGSVGTTKVVDKYSAGCQVFSDASDFAKFIDAAKKHKDLYGNLLTYTLIDERENAIRERTKGDTFYAGEYRYYDGSTGVPIDIYFEGQTPVLSKPADGTTHCAGFTFSVCYITALNRGLLNNFTEEDIKKMWGIWTETDGGKYPKMCVKAISEPMRESLKKLGREVSLENAKPNDFCQIWRNSGTAHECIVVEKIMENNQIVGIKYLSSNPIVNPDTNKTGIGLVAERFSDMGGTMLRANTYFARVDDEESKLEAKPIDLSAITKPQEITTLDSKGKNRGK